jgi:lipoyl(octanoyl) transferase
MKVFSKLQLWMDPVRREGPEAMAVDEWLLETAQMPVLRVYRWAGEWASIGYFGEIAAARAAFPGVRFVRRWTGGGLVDHRSDWTYTVVAPHGEPMAGWRGAESYRRIHAALAEALLAEGVAASLSDGQDETGFSICFENPVTHDLLRTDGRKLAGAGQRRSRRGLLHQGSVGLACDDAMSNRLAVALASQLSGECEELRISPDPAALIRLTHAKYEDCSWMLRR